MKRFFSFITCIIILGVISCESDDTRRNDNNNFIGNRRVNFSLNLNLPQFGDLNFNGNTLFLRDEINFVQGVYIFRANESTFIALELAEPNHPLGSCSIPNSITNGKFEYTCGEEKTSYDLLGNKIDGKEGFAMRRYNAILNGNILTITF